ncbi:uncharacterized protein LOC119608170 isoform X2 [Lucilia sericata]|uniref:uncharacterized protein LOC119608170 isoform X2 n=1 Tax=Lucilia sericata TaxID=13632 RepID=UPI0018A872C3|nr:uncharacterized protein LOC119608170 isoform X2 [Lucilia sericata]
MLKYILARNTRHLNGTGNVEADDTNWLDSSMELKPSKVVEEIPAAPEDIFEELPVDPEEEVDLDYFDESILNDIGILQEDALEYVSQRK